MTTVSPTRRVKISIVLPSFSSPRGNESTFILAWRQSNILTCRPDKTNPREDWAQGMAKLSAAGARAPRLAVLPKQCYRLINVDRNSGVSGCIRRAGIHAALSAANHRNVG